MNVIKLSTGELQKNKYFNDHEEVYYFSDPESKLEGFLAIHSTRLGPAVGGTRMKLYSSKEEALDDVLQLSESMSYKCALANVSYGGGKAVIIGDESIKSYSLLEAYGNLLQSLGCRLKTGVDVGISDEDVTKIARRCSCMIGIAKSGVDKMTTSDAAALSVYHSIQSAANKVLGKPLSEVTAAVKGLGKLGSELVGLLSESGSRIIVADIDNNKILKIKEQFPNVEVVDPNSIHSVECDVYAPCALGNEFNEKTVGELKTKIICGGANNQLSSDEIGTILYDKGIVYCPDFIANAGGLINVVDELEASGYRKSRVVERIKVCGTKIEEIINLSFEEKTPTSEVADRMARLALSKK